MQARLGEISPVTVGFFQRNAVGVLEDNGILNPTEKLNAITQSFNAKGIIFGRVLFWICNIATLGILGCIISCLSTGISTLRLLLNEAQRLQRNVPLDNEATDPIDRRDEVDNHDPNGGPSVPSVARSDHLADTPPADLEAGPALSRKDHCDDDKPPVPVVVQEAGTPPVQVGTTVEKQEPLSELNIRIRKLYNDTAKQLEDAEKLCTQKDSLSEEEQLNIVDKWVDPLSFEDADLPKSIKAAAEVLTRHGELSEPWQDLAMVIHRGLGKEGKSLANFRRKKIYKKMNAKAKSLLLVMDMLSSSLEKDRTIAMKVPEFFLDIGQELWYGIDSTQSTYVESMYLNVALHLVAVAYIHLISDPGKTPEAHFSHIKKGFDAVKTAVAIIYKRFPSPPVSLT